MNRKELTRVAGADSWPKELMPLLEALGEAEAGVWVGSGEAASQEIRFDLGMLKNEGLSIALKEAAKLSGSAMPPEEGVERAPDALGFLIDEGKRSSLWLEYGGMKPCRVSFPAGGKRSVEAQRISKFKRGLLGEPAVDGMFETAHRLHPVARVRMGRSSCRYEFAQPVPWPSFAVLDCAVPFEKAAADLAARFGGQAVAAVYIGDGRFKALVV